MRVDSANGAPVVTCESAEDAAMMLRAVVEWARNEPASKARGALREVMVYAETAVEGYRTAMAVRAEVMAEARGWRRAILRVRHDLRHHLEAVEDPCQDRGAMWPCDVARALMDLPVSEDPLRAVDDMAAAS